MAKKNRSRGDIISDMLALLSTTDLLRQLNFILWALRRRGISIRDWDHKEKTVQTFKIIGNRVYLLATGPKEKTEATENGGTDHQE